MKQKILVSKYHRSVELDRKSWCTSDWVTSDFGTRSKYWYCLWYFVHHPNPAICLSDSQVRLLYLSTQYLNTDYRLTRLNHDLRGRKLKELKFYGGFLLTSPKEDFLTGQENLADVILPSNTAAAATNVNCGHTEYVSVNQSDSSMGYVSGEELRNLSAQPRSSESSQPSSSGASSQQATVISMSQPLLGYSRSRPTYRSVNNSDSTI